jgi:hypothetical protein
VIYSGRSDSSGEKYRAQVNYDSADSECREIKTNIQYFKKKTEEAKGALEEPKLPAVEAIKCHCFVTV